MLSVWRGFSKEFCGSGRRVKRKGASNDGGSALLCGGRDERRDDYVLCAPAYSKLVLSWLGLAWLGSAQLTMAYPKTDKPSQAKPWKWLASGLSHFQPLFDYLFSIWLWHKLITSELGILRALPFSPSIHPPTYFHGWCQPGMHSDQSVAAFPGKGSASMGHNSNSAATSSRLKLEPVEWWINIGGHGPPHYTLNNPSQKVHIESHAA